MSEKSKKHKEIIEKHIWDMAKNILAEVNDKERKSGSYNYFEDEEEVLFDVIPIAVDCFLENKEFSPGYEAVRFDFRSAMEKIVIGHIVSEIVKTRKELIAHYKSIAN